MKRYIIRTLGRSGSTRYLQDFRYDGDSSWAWDWTDERSKARRLHRVTAHAMVDRLNENEEEPRYFVTEDAP